MAMTKIVPPSLYKYFGPERVVSIGSNKLRFSALSAFNDPFEGRPEIKGIATTATLRNEISSRLPKSLEIEYKKLPREVRARMPLRQYLAVCKANSTRFVEGSISQFEPMASKFASSVPDRLDPLNGALCLCESRDNLLMWAHYASSHTGYVVEYLTNNSYFNARRSENDEFYHLRQVQYEKYRPSASLTDLEGPELFLVKGEIWTYENEWRILKPLSDASNVIDIKGQKIHLFEYSPSIVKSITVGARASSDVIESLRLFIANNPANGHIQLEQAFPHDSEFKINFRALPI